VDLVENLEWLLWPDLIKNLYKTTRQIKHAIQRYEKVVLITQFVIYYLLSF